jgi:hypothetical protein
MEKVWRIIQLIAALGTVYFGFALSSCSEQSRIEREYIKVRAALKIEIEINDGKVRDIWEKANNYEPNPRHLKGNLSEDEKVELLKYDFFKKTLYNNFPRWAEIVWEKHNATAAVAIDSATFKSIYQYYENLSKLSDTSNRVFEDKRRGMKYWKDSLKLAEQSKSLAQIIIPKL